MSIKKTTRGLHRKWWWDYHHVRNGGLKLGMKEEGHPKSKYVFFVETPEGDHGRIQAVLDNVADAHNRLPALEAVAEAARIAMLCCTTPLQPPRPWWFNNLLSALDDLDKKS